MAERIRPFIKVIFFVLRDWERRLTLLFIGLFILQFVRWFAAEDGGWLPLTVQAVEYSMLFIFVVLIPVRMWIWLRFVLQLVGVLVINALAVDYQFIGFKITSFQDCLDWLTFNFHQLHPYIWFIFGVWLAYLFLLWWVKAKWRIAVFVIVCVVGIAIRDSYSVNELWSQTAMMIFCGLCLLVIHHFAALKRKNPSSWAYIAEYPGALALPVVLILGLTMFLGSLAPDVSNILTDPYTLYKSWKGEVVEKIIKNGGSSASASASAGNSSSGYSRNDDSLGGGFDFDYSPVMKVDSSQRSYWRGETRSFYTGTGWVTSDKEKSAGVSGKEVYSAFPKDPRIDTSKLKTVDVNQTVTFENDTQYPVLFGAFSISSILTIYNTDPMPNLVSWLPGQNELRWQHVKQTVKLPYPKTYSLVSKVPVIDEAGLRGVTAEPKNAADLSEYLQLPDALPQRVKDLSQTITAGALTPYDKVKAIEDYLRNNYPYTSRPNLKLGKSKDFVDRFLFEIKEGYCDYYSTSMAVLTRSIGIPTRWVKGFTSGTSSQEEARQHGNIPDSAVGDLNGPDVYAVRNSNAHSWVEVYFEGWGWIPFEPTSGFVLPKATPENEALPLINENAVPLEAEKIQKKTIGFKEISITAGSSAALLAIAYFLLRQKIKTIYRSFSIARRRKQRKAINLNEQLVHDYNRLLRQLRRKGVTTEEHETAREMFQRLSERKGWLKKELEMLLSLFEKAKYSGKSVTPEELRQATLSFKRVRQDI
jgi:transglutaminase-like putative cysteine protease/uncharacterized membrane protein YgcG